MVISKLFNFYDHNRWLKLTTRDICIHKHSINQFHEMISISCYGISMQWLCEVILPWCFEKDSPIRQLYVRQFQSSENLIQYNSVVKNPNKNKQKWLQKKHLFLSFLISRQSQFKWEVISTFVAIKEIQYEALKNDIILTFSVVYWPIILRIQKVSELMDFINSEID